MLLVVNELEIKTHTQMPEITQNQKKKCIIKLK